MNSGGTAQCRPEVPLRDFGAFLSLCLFSGKTGGKEKAMIKVNLKGSEKEFESGVSVADVAKSIGMGL